MEKITEEKIQSFCESLPDPENLEEDTERFMAAMEAVQKRFAGQKVTIKEILDFLDNLEE